MRYAGFWPRLGAGLIDLVVFIPLIWAAFWSMYASRSAALLLAVPIGILGALYSVYFVGRWGQTLGKMAIGIKVVRLDGTKAGYARAFYRHSVDLGLSVVSTMLTLIALFSINAYEYDPLPFEGKLELYANHLPSWSSTVDWLTIGWYGSELIVLLFNEKRRAIHDYIAGTVVIHTRGEQPIKA